MPGEWWLLGALLPLLFVPLAPLGLALLAFGWLRGGRPPVERWGAGLFLGLATLAATAAVTIEVAPRVRTLDSWSRASTQRYEAVLEDLRRLAKEAATEVDLPEPVGSQLGAFESLDQLRRRLPESAGTTFLLLDPDGDPVAWSGPGLRHELPLLEPGAQGFRYVGSFRAATILAVESVPGGRRPWILLAGRSFSTFRLPFEAPLGGPSSSYRWSLLDAGAAREGEDLVLRPREGPVMVVEPSPSEIDPVARWRRIAWFAVAAALLLVGLYRGVGLLTLSRVSESPDAEAAEAGREGVEPVRGDRAWALALVVAGGVSLGLGAGVGSGRIAWLAAGLLAAGLALPRPLRPPGPGVATLVGGVAAGLLVGLYVLVQHLLGPVDLSTDLAGGVASTALGLGGWGLLFALWTSLRVRREGGARPSHFELWGWLGAAFLLFTGASADAPWLAIPLLVLAGGAVSRWWCVTATGIGSLATIALLSGLGSAAAWETAFRIELKSHLRSEALPLLAPPGGEEVERLIAELDAFFGDLDLEAVYHGATDAVEEMQDLPLLLWERSPLARRGALSAIFVRGSDGQAETFTFGLPVDLRTGELDEESERWPEPERLMWSETLGLVGSASVSLAGEPWGEVRYWMVPQPGYGLAKTRVEELEVVLLRGEPLRGEQSVELPGGVRYAFFDSDGDLVFAPWGDGSTLTALAARFDAGSRVTLGDSPFWAWSEDLSSGEEGGLAVILLPALSTWEGVTRVTQHAAALLALLAAVVFSALLLGLLKPGFRDAVRRSLQSYSKRLVAVYTLLLVAPLLFLNLVLFQGMGSRLQQEQRSGGEAALQAAQRILGDYLPSLRPGFSVETYLDDDLLSWLSEVVRHEVNLYWRGHVNASSKPELFAAGLLPRRIPGEVYSRLTLLGSPIAGRTNRLGEETTYLELYGPLRIGGQTGVGSLFLSVPLLAQQEELTAELVQTMRQALLLTTALLVLLLAVGGRLARSFTTPLMEIVGGTRRIAAGEVSLGLSPSEPELSALVSAIDDMARRIAEGRSRLVREKRVIEGMVDNITSAVVSVDDEGRVLLRNRVAGELLGLEVGDPLRRLEEEERLRSVAHFVAEGDGEVRRATARIRSEGEEEDREWTLVWVPVPGSGTPAALLVVEDVTEVLRGQRLEAWAEMARMIAHEIKNPLTPIRLSTEHLQRLHASDSERFEELFERCTGNILAQVDELQQIAADFSSYSRIPKIEPRSGNVVETVQQVVEGYRSSPPPGVEVRMQCAFESLELRHDAKLLGRALRNLLENALRASAGEGEVEVAVERQEGAVTISVLDRGPGVERQDLKRIFDPYFSASSGGTGLGLPIARRIVEEHGGAIAAHNRPAGGLEVTIRIPIS